MPSKNEQRYFEQAIAAGHTREEAADALAYVRERMAQPGSAYVLDLYDAALTHLLMDVHGDEDDLSAARQVMAERGFAPSDEVAGVVASLMATMEITRGPDGQPVPKRGLSRRDAMHAGSSGDQRDLASELEPETATATEQDMIRKSALSPQVIRFLRSRNGEPCTLTQVGAGAGIAPEDALPLLLNLQMQTEIGYAVHGLNEAGEQTWAVRTSP